VTDLTFGQGDCVLVAELRLFWLIVGLALDVREMLIDKLQEWVIKPGIFFGLILNLIMLLIPFAKCRGPIHILITLPLTSLILSIPHKLALPHITITRRGMSFHEGSKIIISIFLILGLGIIVVVDFVLEQVW
jgi:hypothetical protein